LQDAFKGTAQLGLSILPADEADRKKYLELLRQNYEEALWKARQFFLEQKLFIPATIADCAESTLGAAVKEKNFHDIFAGHPDKLARSQYTENLPNLFKDFTDGMAALEKLMREHIDGERLNFQTARK
jgi:hypothetical protein